MGVTLKAERPFLDVEVGEEHYKLPLTFTHTEYEEMAAAGDGPKAIIGFFRKYLGDLVDMIGDDDFVILVKAWKEAREALGAPSAGEPSASPDR